MRPHMNTRSADDHDLSQVVSGSTDSSSSASATREGIDDEDPELIEEFLPGLGVSVLGGIGLLIVAAIVVALTL